MAKIIRSTVTSKGQITLPKVVRDQLRATRGTQLEFVIEGNTIVVRNITEPENPFQAWLGVAPLPEGQTVDGWIKEIRDPEDAEDDINKELLAEPQQRVVYWPSGKPLKL